MGYRVMMPAASKVAVVIEVRADPGGNAPGSLLGAAYRASREGTVVLVLNGVSATQVDRALDSVVARVGGVAGVAYCTPSTLERLLQECGWPSIAFVGTRTIAAPLTRHGVRVLPPEALGAPGEWSGESVPEGVAKGDH
jgi:hypothetical protein